MWAALPAVVHCTDLQAPTLLAACRHSCLSGRSSGLGILAGVYLSFGVSCEPGMLLDLVVAGSTSKAPMTLGMQPSHFFANAGCMGVHSRRAHAAAAVHKPWSAAAHVRPAAVDACRSMDPLRKG